ncbi:MAG: hypothetical protein ACYTHK_01725 [Planctomycetota bacterium]
MLRLAPLILLTACGHRTIVAEGTFTVEPSRQTDVEAHGKKDVTLELDGRSGPTVELIFFESARRKTALGRSRFGPHSSLRRRTADPQFFRIVNASDQTVEIHYRVTSEGSAALRTYQ